MKTRPLIGRDVFPAFLIDRVERSIRHMSGVFLCVAVGVLGGGEGE